MTAESASKILRGSGHLVLNPTSALTGTAPFGGTALGYSQDVVLRRLTESFRVTAEEWGGVTVEKTQAGEAWLVAGFLRAWDPDLLTVLFPNTRTGTRTNTPIVQAILNKSGGKRAGHRLSERAVKLLFVPDDPDRVPAWICYRALPDLDTAQALGWDHEKELGLPFAFESIPLNTSQLHVGETGRLVDLTLSPS